MNRKDLLSKQGVSVLKRRDELVAEEILKREDALEMNEGRQNHEGTPPAIRNNLKMSSK